MADLAILGAGSWGTSLAVHAARQGLAVRLLFRRSDAAATAAATRVNSDYLPDAPLPDQVLVTADPATALAGVDLALVVTPVKGLDLAARWLAEHARERVVVVTCAKGIREPDLETPTRVLAAALPALARRLAVLSGPTFARELVRGDPTAAVVAAHDLGLARQVQERLSGGALRLYTNEDVRGVELAGALKNVIALAAGVVEGLGYGSNTTAALITRGLAEVTRLGLALGGRPSTFAGLAGMGDLVLTCTGALSRNRTVGRELGRGRSLAEITSSMKMVAEGVSTAAAAHRLAARHGVEMPIVEQVAAILFHGQSPAVALAELLARQLREEGPEVC